MNNKQKYTNLYKKLLFIRNGFVETDGPLKIQFGELVSFKHYNNNNLFIMALTYLNINKQQLKIIFNFDYFIINEMLLYFILSFVTLIFNENY